MEQDSNLEESLAMELVKLSLDVLILPTGMTKRAIKEIGKGLVPPLNTNYDKIFMYTSGALIDIGKYMFYGLILRDFILPLLY